MGRPDRKEWNKKKREKSALEATILDLNIKKSKIEASILAIVTDRSSGGSTISSPGGNRKTWNAFGGCADKAQIKKKMRHLVRRGTPQIFRLRKEKYH